MLRTFAKFVQDEILISFDDISRSAGAETFSIYSIGSKLFFIYFCVCE